MKLKYPGDRGGMQRLALVITLFCVLFLLLPACESGEPAESEEEAPTLTLSSSAFGEGERIPGKYTCKGEDISPPLAWSEPPGKTKCFVLIMDDPDAPGVVFTHWVLFNLPPDAREIPEGVSARAQLANGALHGRNGFLRLGYRGPCPPPGFAHRYRFTLYALDRRLDLMAGVTKAQVLDAMQRHILAEGLLTGTQER